MNTQPLPDKGSAQYYLLDVGRDRYGDCTLCVFPDATVLIDGGHPSDYNGQAGFLSIPEQLSQILEKQPPFEISLLVVTHCHSDHIGCLPQLLANGDIRVQWALVADEKLGFGRAADGSGADAFDEAPDAVKRVVAALREEDHGHLVGAALDRFLADAATLEQRYTEMLQTLEEQGTRVVRYGKDNYAGLEQAFQSIGLKVLGPTTDQLVICAHAITQFTNDAVVTISNAQAGDAALTDVSLYRQLLKEGGISDAADRVGKGAAINDTSLVLKLGDDEGAALFTGDMQFAKPETPGIEDLMSALVQTVNDKGPYKFIKLSHHSSYNGIDEEILSGWKDTPFLGHSGGSNDPTHPDAGTLALLKKHRNRLKYARTDHNGLILFDPPKGFQISQGRLNDFSPNKSLSKRGNGDEPTAAEEKVAAPLAVSESGTFRSVVRVPLGDAEVTLTYEVISRRFDKDRREAAAVASHAMSTPVYRPPIMSKPGATVPQLPQKIEGLLKGRLAGGRKLPQLLFATNSKRLAANIGLQECSAALKMIQDGGQALIDVPGSTSAFAAVRTALRKTKYEGVVILGGYDVLPAQRLDVLTPQMRTALGSQVYNDPDGFIVWSDFIYGDMDGDGLANLPVSRIPDARSSRLVLAALGASAPVNSVQRFGIRNSARPFANNVWRIVPGTSDILVSGPTKASDIRPDQVNAPCHYFMLHGSDSDSSRFWGEVPGYVEAINVNRLPGKFVGFAFAGCCWGALIAQQTAYNYTSGSVTPKSVEDSIALSLLAGGGTAFVGCTGVHYSPDASASYFGGPMHLSFWNNLVDKKRPPASALFQACIDYISGMPHGRKTVLEQAIERKILMQFTCLGLGW